MGPVLSMFHGAPSPPCPCQFNYVEGNGFTLVYQGVQLADLSYVWDSGSYQWPIIREGVSGACACCDLCRAQPNAQVCARCCFVCVWLCV